jgi:hypothetical protein
MNLVKRYILRYRQKMDEHIVETVAAAKINGETFGPYKNYCKGERDIVVCGAGPTLQNYKPIDGALHMAVNRAFIYDKVNFEFIYSIDFDGILMCQQELIEYHPEKCVKFLATSDSPDIKKIPESFALKCNAKRFVCDYYIYGDGFRSKPVHNIDVKPVGGMPNAGMSAVEVALFMNPRKLYIVGCDMSGTHRIDANMTKEQLIAEKKQYDNYWRTEQQRLLNKWDEIKKFAEKFYPDTEIISINPVGLKGVFKDVYQE